MGAVAFYMLLLLRRVIPSGEGGTTLIATFTSSILGPIVADNERNVTSGGGVAFLQLDF